MNGTNTQDISHSPGPDVCDTDAAAIFSQSTGVDVSDEETMSCDNEPPAALRLSSSGQTQQPSPTPLLLWAPQTPQTSKAPTPNGMDFHVGMVV